MNSHVFILNTLLQDHHHHSHPPPLPHPTHHHHLSCPHLQCPPPPPPPTLSPCPEHQPLHTPQANPHPQKSHLSQSKSSSPCLSAPWHPSDSAWWQPFHDQPRGAPQQACLPTPTQ